jgi:hypothetical protein
MRECLVAAIELAAFIAGCVSWLGLSFTSTHSVGEAPFDHQVVILEAPVRLR